MSPCYLHGRAGLKSSPPHKCTVSHMTHPISDFNAGVYSRTPSKEEVQHASSERGASAAEAAAAKAESRWGHGRCLPVCCPLPQSWHKRGLTPNEEAEAKLQLDAVEEVRHEHLFPGCCLQL